jgi:hypothetical protein
LNKANVIIKSCPYISLTKALQWSRAPKTNVLNFEKPKIQIIAMDNKINFEIMVNGQIYPNSDCMGCGSTTI